MVLLYAISILLMLIASVDMGLYLVQGDISDAISALYMMGTALWILGTAILVRVIQSERKE